MTTNIVNCELTSTTAFITTRSLYQYDHGIKLMLSGMELPNSYEVHFANSKNAESTTTVIGSDDGVRIPDNLLQTGRPVYAWIYISQGEGDAETVSRVEIPVITRPPIEHEDELYGRPTLSEPFMSFEQANELIFPFYIPIDDIDDTKIIINDIPYLANQAEEVLNGSLLFKYGVDVDKMRDSITVRVENSIGAEKIFTVNENPVNSYMTTPETYFNTVRASAPAESLFLDFINAYDTFGKYTQIERNYNVENVGTVEELETVDPDDLAIYRASSSGSATGLTIANTKLRITDSVKIVFLVTLNGYSIEEYTISINGKIVTDFPEDSGYISFTTDNIGINDYGTPVVVSIKNNTVGDTMFVEYSPLTYVRSILRASSVAAVKNELTAMYWMWMAYKEYIAE